MIFFYSIWGFFFIILNYTHIFLENFFFIKNNPFFLRKRTFKFLSYFEKLLLVLFYKKGWFEKSMSNLYRKKDIIEYRRNFYPIIYSFHINHDKVVFSIDDLKFFTKQYKYFLKNQFFNKKLIFFFKNCFKFKNTNFLNFLIIETFFFEKYFNFNNYFNFKTKSNLNLIKLNRLFLVFLKKSKKKLILFNLNKWDDWYNFNFKYKNLEYCNIKIKLTKGQKKRIKEFKLKNFFNWINVVYKYKKRIKNVNSFFSTTFNGIIHFKLNYNSIFKIKVNREFFKLLKYYIIKFSESSVSKHINKKNLKFYNIQFLRKNRIFNKGRYSRNRQLYRTGVYWCLWLNIIMVYGLYFIFYRFTFNFGYFWWGILVLAYSTIFSRIVKYNFHNINYVIKEFKNLIKWYGYLFYNLINLIENYVISILKNINITNKIFLSIKSKPFFTILIDYFNYYFSKYSKIIIKKRKKIKIGYFWQGMKEKDTSFFRYKTILHWIKEIYRLIVT